MLASLSVERCADLNGADEGGGTLCITKSKFLANVSGTARDSQRDDVSDKGDCRDVVEHASSSLDESYPSCSIQEFLLALIITHS